MKINPQQINGSWVQGVVLDYHTVSSEFLGYDEEGKPQFDNTYTEVGDLLHRFKYKQDSVALNSLLSVADRWFSRQNFKFDILVPIPPSKHWRTVTARLAQGLANRYGGEYSNKALQKRETKELKGIEDPKERKRLLSGALNASSQLLEGKTVLLVDDLYRSGATLESATQVVYKQGKAKAVYVFAFTRTRVKR